MADDKRNISDGGNVDDPPKPGKVEPAKAALPVQDQPAQAKAEAPKDKDAPAPSKGDTPPGKDEKQTTIPGMGDPAPAGKVVDFTAARDGATKGKPPEKAVAPDKGKQADKAKDAAKPRRGRPPKADKAAPDKAKPQPRDKMFRSRPTVGKGAPAMAEAPAAAEQPPAPRDATRGVKEEIVYLNLSELHPFKNHPFGVRDDAEMQGLVESVKAAGVNQPALVRPREGGGYEIIAGHRRQRASELAGFVNMPCIVRDMTDDEAILAMTDDNLRHRERILPTEKAAALKQQVEAIKHQGARPGEDDRDAGKRSTQIVGDRNGMNYKQVQRYIRLTELVPDLQKMVDEKQLSFTPAVEISFIRPKHQKYIAGAIEGQASSPSLSQAQKMRELDKEGKLNGDVIDGMKRPLAYITAAWCGEDYKNTEQAARYCRAVYEAGFSPICPTLYLPLFLNDAVPEEHKSGIDMSRDLLRRSHVLVVCGHTVTEAMKNDIAVAQRLGITATTLEGILTVKGQGRR